MNKKEIEQWKILVSKNKNIFVAKNVKSIHPVADRIVSRLFEIDPIKYVRLTQDDLQASSEITVKGRTKIPISRPEHPTAIGVHLILDLAHNTIQFFEMTSAIKGYGGRMVRAVLSSIPDDWQAVVAMDWSGGFWDRMAKKYDNILIL